MSDIEERADYKTRFKGKGVGVRYKQKPVSTTLPPQYDEIVRSLPNRAEYIREAVIEKLEKDGLLPKAG